VFGVSSQKNMGNIALPQSRKDAKFLIKISLRLCVFAVNFIFTLILRYSGIIFNERIITVLRNFYRI
jgi:hypothetical protein